MKIESLFPVQKQIIPVISNTNSTQSIYPNDICTLAPTGSGKTLAYVLPIIHTLKTRIRPTCRAIVLLPVADLAEQVFRVFQECLSNTDSLTEKYECFNKSTTSSSIDDTNLAHSKTLRAILLSSKHPFGKEQAQLIDHEHEKCLIDIIVTTPGRLVDHIQKTKGLDLTEVRYLVLDECDRIVEHIKQNWLEVLNEAIFGAQSRPLLTNENLNVHNLISSKDRLVPFQKLLFSATLTRNPEKLEQLRLFQPLYFNLGAESLVVVASKTKKEEDETRVERMSVDEDKGETNNDDTNKEVDEKKKVDELKAIETKPSEVG